jgi:phage major head subunit gpT-like protein
MGAEGIGSRAIIGEFYRRYAELGLGWADGVSMLFQSNQESETYKWLGMSPMMREWVGGRVAKGFREAGVTIPNLDFEATLEVLRHELVRDKSGQIRVRIAELARKAANHWMKLLSDLIVAGEGSTLGLCYDGQFFFDTDHVEGDSGTQSNDITYNVNTTTAPTAAEMEQAILAGVQAIVGFRDDQGDPMNDDAAGFLVMVPTTFYAAAAAAIRNPVIVDGSGSRTNTLANLAGASLMLAINPRLTTWTDRFAVFRTDSATRAFIRQEEEAIVMEAIAAGSEEEFKNKRHLYGVRASRNVGYGFWQDAVLVTLT